MLKFIVFAALLSGSAGAYACGEDLNVDLGLRLENVRAKLIGSLTTTYEPSHVMALIDLTSFWESRLEGLSEEERIDLNGFLTVQELAPGSHPRPRFPVGSKAEQETGHFEMPYFGPY